MSPDWPLWALGSFATGTVYAVSVAVLNRRNHNARGRRWMLAAEVAGATNPVAQPASNRQPKTTREEGCNDTTHRLWLDD